MIRCQLRTTKNNTLVRLFPGRVTRAVAHKQIGIRHLSYSFSSRASIHRHWHHIKALPQRYIQIRTCSDRTVALQEQTTTAAASTVANTKERFIPPIVEVSVESSSELVEEKENQTEIMIPEILKKRVFIYTPTKPSSGRVPEVDTSRNEQQDLVVETTWPEIMKVTDEEMKELLNLLPPTQAANVNPENVNEILPAIFKQIFVRNNLEQQKADEEKYKTHVKFLDDISRKIFQVQETQLAELTKLQSELVDYYSTRSLWQRFKDNIGYLTDTNPQLVADVIHEYLREAGPHEAARVLNVGFAHFEKEVTEAAIYVGRRILEEQFTKEWAMLRAEVERKIKEKYGEPSPKPVIKSALKKYIKINMDDGTEILPEKDFFDENMEVSIRLPGKPPNGISAVQLVDLVVRIGQTPNWRQERYFDFLVDVLSFDGHLRLPLETVRNVISQLPRVPVSPEFITSTHDPRAVAHPWEPNYVVGNEWLPHELGRLIGTITREELEIDRFSDLMVSLINMDWAAQEGIKPANSVEDPGDVSIGPVEENQEPHKQLKEGEVLLLSRAPQKSNTDENKNSDETNNLPKEIHSIEKREQSLSQIRRVNPPSWTDYMGYTGIVLAEALAINKHWVDEDIAWAIHLTAYEVGRFAMRRFADYNIEEHLMWLSDVISQVAVKYGRFKHDYRLIQIILNNVTTGWPEDRHEQLAELIRKRMEPHFLSSRIGRAIRNALSGVIPPKEKSLIEKSLEVGESILWVPPPDLQDAILYDKQNRKLVRPEPDPESIETILMKKIMPLHEQTKQEDGDPVQ